MDGLGGHFGFMSAIKWRTVIPEVIELSLVIKRTVLLPITY